MRVKGGKRFLVYIEGILSGRSPEPQAFAGYDLVFHEGFRGFVDAFEKDLRRSSLTRMVAGFAWPWMTKPGCRLKPGETHVDHGIETEGIKLR